MDLTSLTAIDLPPTADFHCHLREGAMMELVAPIITTGGCDTVFVMPNLEKPIVSVAQALAYHRELRQLAPNVRFLMSLYLHPDVTTDEIELAARSNIVFGVKLYPAGVTTNSQHGVRDIERYYPVFEAMQRVGLVLNLHGESMNCTPDAATVHDSMHAEFNFLPQLFNLHEDFPDLRIVLEHVSTKEGVDAVKQCGPNVRGTITAHHLWGTIEDAENDVFNFCKPIMKTHDDRLALIRAAVDGSSKFFFGSDSAPHPIQSKAEKEPAAAGCFTQPWSTSLVIGAFQRAMSLGWISKDSVSREAIEGFLSHHGRTFYKIAQQQPEQQEAAAAIKHASIRLERKGERIPGSIKSLDGKIEVVPFRRGEEVMSLTWLD
ncbi:MAG: hypothetical protein Q9173_000105 [Seirophora scorigena]